MEGDQAGLRGLFVLSITADCFPPLPPPSHSPSLRLTITQFAFTPTNRRPGRCYAPPPRTLLLGRACACVRVCVRFRRPINDVISKSCRFRGAVISPARPLPSKPPPLTQRPPSTTSSKYYGFSVRVTSR